jgi:thioredoxin 1
MFIYKGEKMKKLIIPVLIIVLFIGCDFFAKSKKSAIQIKSSDTNVIHINDKNRFEEVVLKASKPAVVKFETKWCSACKTMAPIYAKIANEYADKIIFTTIDAGQLSEIADKYEIQGVPTFIFFKDGKIVNKIEGAVLAEQFEEITQKLL